MPRVVLSHGPWDPWVPHSLSSVPYQEPKILGLWAFSHFLVNQIVKNQVRL